LTDQHPGSLDIEVVAALAGDRVDLRLRALASQRAAPLPASIIYHALGWEEVAILAAAHGVLCDCKGEVATLRFALLPPAPQ